MGLMDKIRSPFGRGKASVPRPDAKKEKAPSSHGREEKAKGAGKQALKAAPTKMAKGKVHLAYRVIVRPLATEKATALAKNGQYVFEVEGRANKIEVKKAIRALYGVDVISVHTAWVKGKTVQFRRRTGRTKDWKRAVVSVKPGQKITIAEGV